MLLLFFPASAFFAGVFEVLAFFFPPVLCLDVIGRFDFEFGRGVRGFVEDIIEGVVD